MELTPLQETVIEAARAILAQHPEWSGQVCLDCLSQDWYIERVGIEKAADEIAMDTAFWENLLFS
jgi:hypothetical protein